MSNATLAENKEKISQKDDFRFNWQDSPPVQRLLDGISSIIAQEYIQIAKENQEIFKESEVKK